MAKWPPHDPPREKELPPELPPEPVPEPVPEPPYVYGGDGEHLQAAIDASATPVNPRAVRGLKPYHDAMHALASASVNPADGENILMSVQPHLATLQVAIDAATAAVAEVADGLGIALPAVLGGEGEDRPGRPVKPGPGPGPAQKRGGFR